MRRYQQLFHTCQRRLKQAAVALATIVALTPAYAYEVLTHERVTLAAVNRSVVATNYESLFTNLGFPLPNSTVFTPSNGGAPTSVFNLIAFGARWEDEQYERRALHHFYDPQYNQGIGRGFYLRTIGGDVIGHASPDWALEDVVVSNDTSAPNGTQEFSFRDANVYFYNALTAQNYADRLSAFSRAMQSLGHAVHHVQDMAQPQHVRNDQHYHPFPNGDNPIWSAYEKYSEAKLTPERIASLSQANPVSIPTVRTARELWRSAYGSLPFRGMAEFTAQNYTSYGTQYQLSSTNQVLNYPGFPLPNGTNRSGSAKRIELRPKEVRLPFSGRTITHNVPFLMGEIHDDLRAQPYLDQHLAQLTATGSSLSAVGGSLRAFADNSAPVMDDQHRVLIPRAVAFSAALINHFFRGQVNLTVDGDSKTWRVTNTSVLPMNGTFVILAESGAGVRTALPGHAYTQALAAGASFTFPLNDPISGATKLIVAFRGQIGNEGDATLGSGYYATAGKVSTYVAPPLTCTPPQVLQNGACVTPPPPAAACGTQLAASGSSQGLDQLVDMGGTPGTVQVEFDALQIPDALEIRADNAVRTLLTSTGGMVSGLRNLTFQHDPARSQRVRVRVTGNSDTGTYWTVRTSCPGGALAPLPSRNVSFTVQGNTCGAIWNVSIDGDSARNIPFSRSLVIRGGYRAVGGWTMPPLRTCGGSSQTHPGSVYYNDGSGNRLLGGGFSGFITVFDVR